MPQSPIYLQNLEVQLVNDWQHQILLLHAMLPHIPRMDMHRSHLTMLRYHLAVHQVVLDMFR
jgi:hypothetical protein